MNWYRAVLKKYAVFSGRVQRAEYWYFVLFNIIGTIWLLVLMITDSNPGDNKYGPNLKVGAVVN